MPAWDDLLTEFGQVPDEHKSQWFGEQLSGALNDIAAIRSTGDGPRNVITYASGFLQKPTSRSGAISVAHEDINGLMSVIYGMDWSQGLTLLLHTPGGSPNAAESIVAYLRSKFEDIEVIVPTLAMSAGTMISLAADRVVMGRQSQLGPIDPQFVMGGRMVSARGVVEQFKRAEHEILANPAAAHVWAPITQSLGPALLQDAQNALDYSEEMVARWLANYMFAGDGAAAKKKGQDVAQHFNDASTHKSHGRRIDRDEAAAQGIVVEHLEANQNLQEAVLTAYHLSTMVFEHTPTVKMIVGSNDRTWLKNDQAA